MSPFTKYSPPNNLLKMLSCNHLSYGSKLRWIIAIRKLLMLKDGEAETPVAGRWGC